MSEEVNIEQLFEKAFNIINEDLDMSMEEDARDAMDSVETARLKLKGILIKILGIYIEEIKDMWLSKGRVQDE